MKACHFNAGVGDHYLMNHVGAEIWARSIEEQQEIGKIYSLYGRKRCLGVWGSEWDLFVLFVS